MGTAMTIQLFRYTVAFAQRRGSHPNLFPPKAASSRRSCGPPLHRRPIADAPPDNRPPISAAIAIRFKRYDASVGLQQGEAQLDEASAVKACCRVHDFRDVRDAGLTRYLFPGQDTVRSSLPSRFLRFRRHGKERQYFF